MDYVAVCCKHEYTVSQAKHSNLLHHSFQVLRFTVERTTEMSFSDVELPPGINHKANLQFLLWILVTQSRLVDK